MDSSRPSSTTTGAIATSDRVSFSSRIRRPSAPQAIGGDTPLSLLCPSFGRRMHAGPVAKATGMSLAVRNYAPRVAPCRCPDYRRDAPGARGSRRPAGPGLLSATWSLVGRRPGGLIPRVADVVRTAMTAGPAVAAAVRDLAGTVYQPPLCRCRRAVPAAEPPAASGEGIVLPYLAGSKP